MIRTLLFALLFAPAAFAEIHPEYLEQADKAINDAIADHKCPGAVLLVGTADKTVYLKAYGHRALQPQPVPMTTDTIFDLASLSKSVGCAPSAMILVERGKIDVHQKAAHYLPGFGNHGKEEITVEELLLHRAGLIADDPIEDYKDGRTSAFAAMDQSTPRWKPNTHYTYSDVSFITLGRIVEAASGEPLDKFAAENLFQPLGMSDTAYNPPESWRPRIAPTQMRDGHWMIGEVHDPRAYAMGGVAGHAGLFSTAQDLATFCQMILHNGELNGHRVMSEATVKMWTETHNLPAKEDSDEIAGRTYGFDVDTPYSGPRGDRFERGTTFGHTGFTGTAFWIDPRHKCFYILLTNSVHPDGKGNVLALRRKVGTLAAEALLGPAGETQPSKP